MKKTGKIFEERSWWAKKQQKIKQTLQNRKSHFFLNYSKDYYDLYNTKQGSEFLRDVLGFSIRSDPQKRWFYLELLSSERRKPSYLLAQEMAPI